MSKRQDVEKAKRWQRTIREAARSGLSIREFCRQRRLKVSQFYLVAAPTGADPAALDQVEAC